MSYVSSVWIPWFCAMSSKATCIYPSQPNPYKMLYQYQHKFANQYCSAVPWQQCFRGTVKDVTYIQKLTVPWKTQNIKNVLTWINANRFLQIGSNLDSYLLLP